MVALLHMTAGNLASYSVMSETRASERKHPNSPRKFSRARRLGLGTDTRSGCCWALERAGGPWLDPSEPARRLLAAAFLHRSSSFLEEESAVARRQPLQAQGPVLSGSAHGVLSSPSTFPEDRARSTRQVKDSNCKGTLAAAWLRFSCCSTQLWRHLSPQILPVTSRGHLLLYHWA